MKLELNLWHGNDHLARTEAYAWLGAIRELDASILQGLPNFL